MSDPLVSVVILNYNGSLFIERCLRSVMRTRYPNFEIILVDNASTDDSLEQAVDLCASDGRSRVVSNARNIGFAGGNNVGIRRAGGKYIVLLNLDTEVEPRWMEHLIETVGSDDRIGGAQSKLLLAQNPRRLDSVGHYLDYCGVESPGSAVVQGQRDRAQYDRVRGIFYGRGAALALNKEALNVVGLLDESYFAYYEEADLCWRMRLAGFRVLYVPESVVLHHAGGIAGHTDSPERLFHLRKNHIATLIKNYEGKNMVKYLAFYLTFLLTHGIYKAVRGETHFLTAYVRAMLWILRNTRTISLKRRIVQKYVRKVPDTVVMRLMTKPRIPWYFL